MKLDRILIGAALMILLGAALVAMRLAKKEANLIKVDRSRTETGRWIVYDSKNLFAKPGQKAFAVQGAEQIEGLNAYAIESFNSPDEKMFQTFDRLPPGWKVQKEYVHHIFPFSCSRCESIECPGTAPTPSPTPTPTPVEDDKSWGRARVHAKEAMKLVDTSKVKICVVDTGLDLNHANRGNIVGTKDFTGKGTAQDGNGHGTHVAGTVAGKGGVGVSSGSLYVCKGLDDRGSGSTSSLAQCLNWCGTTGAQIVSNSWGSPQSDPLINQTINQLTAKGIYVFVAAGNDSGPVNWPAKLAGQNQLVYAIAASTKNDQIASFSSRGPEIRFISPGDEIISNWPGGGTKSLSGTSMATPHAASICAFGIAKGIKPCIKTTGTVGGYPFADSLETAK